MIEKVITEAMLEQGHVRVTPTEVRTLDLPEHSTTVEVDFEGSTVLAKWNSATGHLAGDAFAERLQEYCQIGGLLRLRALGHGLAMETVARSQSTLRSPTSWRTTPSAPATRQRASARHRRTAERKFRAADEFDWSGDQRIGFLRDARTAFLNTFAAGGFDPPHLVQLRIEGERLATLDGFEELLAIDVSNVDHMPHQEAVASQVLSRMRGRAVLADEVGLGKTIEAGLVVKELALRGLARRVLVLCPATLRDQWRGEMESKFELDFDVAANGPSIGSQDRLILSLQLAARNLETLSAKPWDVVIIDEAHRAAGQNARRTRELVQTLGRDSRYMLMLTATPVQNSLTELYRLVEMLRPGTLGTEAEFMRRFVDRSDPRRPTNPADLRRLVSSAMLRTTRAQAGVDRVKRRTKDVPITLGPAEVELYLLATELLRTVMTRPSDAIRRRHLAHRLAGSPYAMGVTALNMAERMDDQRTADVLRRIGNMAMNIPVSAREQRLLEQTRTWLEEHGRVLVFTQHTDTVQSIMRLLDREGISAVPFHGGVSAQGRRNAIEQFRSGAARVLVSTDAGAEGQNLQFCNCVINYDLPWNPMRIEQRIGRVDRLTQPRDEVFVANFFAKNTIDERVYRLLHDKLRMFELLFGQVTTILGELEDEKGFEGRILDALYAADDSAMERLLTELGSSLEKARELGQAMVGADQGLSAWLATSKDYRQELAGQSASELMPERAERERQRQQRVQRWARSVLAELGAFVVHDTGEHDGAFVTYELPEALSDDLDGRRFLHLAFDRRGLEHHPEAELCTVGAPVFAELLGLLRERGDLHVAVPVPPPVPPDPMAHDEGVVERVDIEWVPSGNWSGTAAFRLEVGDLELTEQMLEVPLAAESAHTMERKDLSPADEVPNFLRRPHMLVRVVEEAAEERARQVRSAAESEMARRIAEERARVLQQFDDRIEAEGFNRAERLRLLEARKAEEQRFAKPPEVRARLELLALSVSQFEPMLRETWRHVPSDATFTIDRVMGEAPAISSVAGGSVLVRLSSCRSGHIIDAAERHRCGSCHEDVCTACATDGEMRECVLCGMLACGRCRAQHSGLCRVCSNLERAPADDDGSMLCWITPNGAKLLVGRRAAFVDTGSGPRLVVPASDVDDDVRARLRDHAMSVGASPDAGFVLRVIEVPEADPDREIIASVDYSDDYELSVEAGAGGDIDEAALPLASSIPRAPEVDTVSERGAGLEELLEWLRAASLPPVPDAIVITRAPTVREQGVYADGVFDRRVTVANGERQVITASVSPWTADGSHGFIASLPGIRAHLRGSGNAVLVTCQQPGHETHWCSVPDDSNLSSELSWGAFAEQAGVAGAAVRLLDQPQLSDTSFLQSTQASLIDRSVVSRWEAIEAGELPTHSPRTGDLEAGGRVPAEVGLHWSSIPGELNAPLSQLLADRPQVVAFLRHTATDVWEQHAQTRVTYTVSPGGTPHLVCADGPLYGGDFGVCSAGHVHDGAAGECEACGEWRCLGCDASGPLHECRCRRHVCLQCRSVERRMVEQHCRSCGTRSCSSCGATPRFVTCRGCLRSICESCTGGAELCGACRSLRPADAQLIGGLPTPLAAAGAAVWSAVDGSDRVVWVVAPHRQECAVVTSIGAVENWRSFAPPQPDELRKVCLGHAVKTGRQLQLEQVTVVQRETPTGFVVTSSIEWHVGISVNGGEWAAVGPSLDSPRSSLVEPLAIGLECADVLLPTRSSDTAPSVWPRTFDVDADHLRYAAVRTSRETQLAAGGLTMHHLVGPESFVVSAPWGDAQAVDASISVGWEPAPTVLAVASLDGSRAAVVQHGTRVSVGTAEADGLMRWYEIHGDDQSEASAVVSSVLGTDQPVGRVGAVTDPAALQLTEMSSCSLVRRDVKPLVRLIEGDAAALLGPIRAAWAADTTGGTPPLAELPPDLRAALAASFPSPGTCSVAVGAEVVDEWLSITGATVALSYTVPPGQQASYQLDDVTGMPSLRLWLDREGHRVAEPIRCPYCSALTCPKCEGLVRSCACCGIQTCSTCAVVGELTLCSACSSLSKPAALSRANLRHLRRASPLLAGSDSLHRVEAELLVTGWVLRTWRKKGESSSAPVLAAAVLDFLQQRAAAVAAKDGGS